MKKHKNSYTPHSYTHVGELLGGSALGTSVSKMSNVWKLKPIQSIPLVVTAGAAGTVGGHYAGKGIYKIKKFLKNKFKKESR